MMAAYIEHSVVMQSTGAGECDIVNIWKDINENPARPVKVRNAHKNMQWWLARHFPRIKFEYIQTRDQIHAIESIVRFLDGGFPILVSVSHVNVQGHIVLVVGYENYMPNVSSPDFKIVVNDPYGQFDPSLNSTLFGKNWRQGGASLLSGGEKGPGQNVRLPVTGVSRQRIGDVALGTYYLLSAHR
jgi:hypothetical protein